MGVVYARRTVGLAALPLLPTPSLDLERAGGSLAVRHMAAATIRLQAFHVGCSLVEIACRCIFGNGCCRRLGLHGETHGVICATALFPEFLDLFERGLQLLCVGSGTSTIFGRDLLVHAAHVCRVALHPALKIAVALRQSADHYESGSDCHDIHLSHRHLHSCLSGAGYQPSWATVSPTVRQRTVFSL